MKGWQTLWAGGHDDCCQESCHPPLPPTHPEKQNLNEQNIANSQWAKCSTKISPRKKRRETPTDSSSKTESQWTKYCPRKSKLSMSKIFPPKNQGKEESWWTKCSQKISKQKKKTESHRLILKSRISMNKIYPEISPRKRRILRFPKTNLKEKDEDWTQL